MKKWLLILVLACTLLFSGALAESEYSFTCTEEGFAVITGVSAPEAALILPTKVEGMPVTGIAEGALTDPAITSVQLPQRITAIAPGAFAPGTTIIGWNGSAALAYAEAQGHPCVNLSQHDFFSDVHDLTGADYAVRDGQLCLPAAEAAALREGDKVFVPDVITGEVARTWRITAIAEQDGLFVLSLSAVEATEAVRSIHVAFDNVPLTAGDVTPGENVTLHSVTKGLDDEELKINFTYKLNSHVEMDITLTHSAKASGHYTMEEAQATDQELAVTETVKIKGTLKVKGSAATLDSGTLELLRSLAPIKHNKDLLEFPVSLAGPVSVTASFKLSLSAALAGNMDCTITHEYGLTTIGGVLSEYDNDPIVEADHCSISGSMTLGISASLSMNVVNMGPVMSISASAGVTLDAKEAIQYDETVTCYDITLKMTGNISFQARIGLKPDLPVVGGSVNITLISVNIPIVELSYELMSMHMEVFEESNDLDPCVVRFHRECSIGEELRRTFHFHTGSTQVIPDVHTVIGQAIEAPEVKNVSGMNLFQGWYTALEGGEKYNFSVVPDENTPRETTLYAHWSLPAHQVHIDFDWDAMTNQTLRVLEDDLIPEPTVPLRFEYRFLGFRAFTNGQNSLDGVFWSFNTLHMPDCEMTLRAVWKYEKGYNPTQEMIDSVTGGEGYGKVIDGMTLALMPSTAVQASLSFKGIEMPSALDVLNDLYYFTGAEVASPVLSIPHTVLGKPIVSVDGSGLSADARAALQVLVIPNTVLYLTGFNDCPNLETVIIEGGTYTYEGRGGLPSVFNGVQAINYNCFENCPRLQNIQIGSPVQFIGSYAFRNTHLYETCVPDSVINLGHSVFASCRYLTSAKLPAHFTSLPSNTFNGCRSLKSIDLSQYTEIGNWALANTSLETVEFSPLTAIGKHVVAGCQFLKEITLPSYNYHGETEETLFATTLGSDLPALETLRLGPGNYSVNFDCTSFEQGIDGPVGWNSLREISVTGTINALYVVKYPALERVSAEVVRDHVILQNLPELTTLKGIGIACDMGTADEGLWLENCPKLTHMSWEEFFPWQMKLRIRNCGFTALNLATVVIPSPDGNGEYNFYVQEMADLTFLTLPHGLQTIGKYDCSGLTALEEITLPPTVRTIEDDAFNGCTALRTIHLPEDLESLGAAFVDCESLESLYLPDGTAVNGFLSDARVKDVSIGSSVSNIALDTGYQPFSADWISRLILRSDATTVTYNNVMRDVFVIVCSESSAARTPNQFSNTAGAPLFVTPAQAEGRRFVRFFNNYGPIRAMNDYGSPCENIVYSGFAPGSAIQTPGLVETYEKYSNLVFTGWYLDQYCSKPMPQGMLMPDYDLTLYAGWAEAPSNLTTAPCEGGLTVTGYTGTHDLLTIPPSIGGTPVVAIADGAFAGSSLTRLNLPNTIVSLSPATFAGASALETVHISGSRYASVDGAVYRLNNAGSPSELIFCPPARMGALVIPEGVTAIGASAVSGVEYLSAVTFPEGLTTIGSSAFRLCTDLKELSFPDSLESVGTEAFAGCSALRTAAFAADASLGTAALPSVLGLRITGPVDAPQLAAWAQATHLSYNIYRLTLTDSGVSTTLELQAGSPLSSLTLAGSHTQLFLGWAPEGSTEPLTVMPAADTALQALWQPLMTISDGILTYVDPLAGDPLVIPAEVVRIAEGAIPFTPGCIHIPATVAVIEDNALTGAGRITGDAGTAAESYALKAGIPFEEAVYTLTFNAMGGSECEAITGTAGTAIVLPQPERTGADFLGWALDQAGTQPFDATLMPGASMTLYAMWDVFSGAENDLVVEMEEGFVRIVAYHGSAETMAIPETINGLPVTEIGQRAFQGNTTLRRLTIPARVTQVGQEAFADTALAEVTFLGKDTALGAQVFARSRGLTRLTLPASLTAVPRGMVQGCTSLTEITLPDTVSSIGADAFNGCTFLHTITLPASLTGFSTDMLRGTSLSSIAVSPLHPDLQAAAGALYANGGQTLVYLCPKVEGSFSVPEGVTYIAPRAMENAAITALTLPEGLQSIGDRALSGLRLNALALPEGLTALGSSALNPLPRLKQLDLPDSLVSIGDDAFDMQSGVALFVSSTESPAVAAVDGRWLVQVRHGGPVTGLTLSHTKVSIPCGESVQLTAVLQPADADDQRLSWRSSAPDRVAVDNGLVTGLRQGATAIVTVSSPEGFSASCTVTVTSAPYVPEPFSTRFTGHFATLGDTFCIWYGDDCSFTADVAEATLTADDPRIEIDLEYGEFCINQWYDLPDGSSGQLEDGLTTTLTYQGTDWEGRSFSLKFPIRLFATAQLVGTQPLTADLIAGDTLLLSSGYSSAALNEACSLWSSSDPSVATVDENGLVTALKPGLTTIRHTYAGGSQMTLLKVTASNATISLRASSPIICLNGSITLEATCSDKDAQIRFGSENSAITISGNTASGVSVAATPVRLYAEAVKNGQVIARSSCYVRCLRPVTRVNLSYMTGYVSDAIEANVGTLDLLEYASPYNAHPETVTWHSSDESIVTIDADGTAHVLRHGQATVTATRLADGVTESALLIASDWDVDVRIWNAPDVLYTGESVQLEARVYPDSPNLTLLWEGSSYSRTLTVTEDGQVTGNNPGEGDVYLTVINDAGYEAGSDQVSIPVRLNPKDQITSLTLPDHITLIKGQNSPFLTSDAVVPAGAPLNSDSFADYHTEPEGLVSFVLSINDDKLDLRGNTEGDGVLHLTLHNGSAYTLPITVIAPYVEVTAPASAIAVGQTLQLQVNTCLTGAAPTFRADGSLADCVSISSTGLVTAKAEGSGWIYASIADDATGSTYSNAVYLTILPALPADFSIPATVISSMYDSAVIPVTLPEGAGSEDLASACEATAVTADGDRLSTSVRWESNGLCVYVYSPWEYTTAAFTLTIGSVQHTSTIYFNQTDADYVSLPDVTVVAGQAVPVPDLSWQPVRWSCSDASVATMADGRITGLKEGSTTLTAELVLADGSVRTLTSVLTVTAQPLTVLKFDQTEVTLYPDDYTYLYITAQPADGRTLTLTSSDPAVVHTELSSSSARITALKVGTATVTISDGAGSSASCVVTVPQGVTDVKLNVAGGIDLPVGGTFQLEATALPENAADRQVNYYVYDSIVSITEDGLVTARRPGMATVYIESNDGCYMSTLVVHVLEPLSELTLSHTSISLTAGQSLRLTAASAGETLTRRRVTWHSSDPAVATVSAEGLVTFAGTGKAVITVKDRYGSATAVCTVQCTGLTPDPTGPVLTLPVSLTHVEAEAFAASGSFVRVDTSSALSSIGPRAFADNPTLQLVVIPSMTAVVDATAFDGCADELIIRCPEGSAVWQAAQANGWRTEPLP